MNCDHAWRYVATERGTNVDWCVRCGALRTVRDGAGGGLGVELEEPADWRRARADVWWSALLGAMLTCAMVMAALLGR